MADSVADLQKSMNDAVKEFATLGGLAVLVGLPDDRIHTPSGMPLATIGAIHEFGFGSMPERSFLRGTVHNKQPEIKGAYKVLANKALNGQPAEALMEQFALWGQGLVQQYLRDGIAPPNEAETIRAKNGKATPLINTGALVQGIIGVPVKDD